MSNVNKELGLKVHQHLLGLNIETPFISDRYTSAEKLQTIEQKFKEIMQVIGLDLSDDSLQDTPMRVAKMYTNEIFEGLHYENFPKCTVVENKFHADEMIIESGIDVSSVCEHHFQNIVGTAKVAYIPKDVVLGLSKMNRIVRFFSKRPQIQERLTLQIQAALCFILQTDDVAVEITAVHHCVKARGVEDKNCHTTTRKIGGAFKQHDSTRNEFLNTK